jgi:hypothetical protein
LLCSVRFAFFAPPLRPLFPPPQRFQHDLQLSIPPSSWVVDADVDELAGAFAMCVFDFVFRSIRDVFCCSTFTKLTRVLIPHLLFAAEFPKALPMFVKDCDKRGEDLGACSRGCCVCCFVFCFPCCAFLPHLVLIGATTRNSRSSATQLSTTFTSLRTAVRGKMIDRVSESGELAPAPADASTDIRLAFPLECDLTGAIAGGMRKKMSLHRAFVL